MDTPFRGILYGVTVIPGYERPAVDGELCEDKEPPPVTDWLWVEGGQWEPFPLPPE